MRRSVVVAAVLLGACRRAPRPQAIVAEVPSASVSASTSAPGPAGVLAPPAGVGRLVRLPLGAPLTDTPGGTVTARAQGSPALVVATAAGAIRVLAADGSVGWTKSAPTFAAAEVRITDDNAWNRAPEDPGFREPESYAATVPTGALPLLGATKGWATTSDQAIGVLGAEFLQQPLLVVATGPQRLFAHPLATDLVWTPAGAGLSDLAGLVRPPFLAPFRAPLLALGPSSTATHVLDHGAFVPFVAGPHTWSGVDAVVVDPTAKPGGIAALAVLHDGASICVALSPPRTGASFVLPQNQIGSPLVGRHAIADLDGDGRPEFLIELVERTSHGSFSSLVVVAGTSATGPFVARWFTLGGAPGEGSPDLPYAWWVEGGAAFVVGERAGRFVTERLAWPSGTFAPATTTITSYAADHLTAGRAAAAAGAHAFPSTGGGKVRWAVGHAR